MKASPKKFIVQVLLIKSKPQNNNCNTSHIIPQVGSKEVRVYATLKPYSAQVKHLH